MASGVRGLGVWGSGFRVRHPQSLKPSLNYTRLPAIIDKQARRKEDAWPKSTNAATCALMLGNQLSA